MDIPGPQPDALYDLDYFVAWGNELTKEDPAYAEQIIASMVGSEDFGAGRSIPGKDISQDE